MSTSEKSPDEIPTFRQVHKTASLLSKFAGGALDLWVRDEMRALACPPPDPLKRASLLINSALDLCGKRLELHWWTTDNPIFYRRHLEQEFRTQDLLDKEVLDPRVLNMFETLWRVGIGCETAPPPKTHIQFGDNDKEGYPLIAEIRFFEETPGVANYGDMLLEVGDENINLIARPGRMRFSDAYNAFDAYLGVVNSNKPIAADLGLAVVESFLNNRLVTFG